MIFKEVERTSRNEDVPKDKEQKITEFGLKNQENDSIK